MAMQAWRLSVIGVSTVFLIAAPRASAVLGASADECKRAYERSFGGTTQEVKTPARIKYHFQWQTISVEAHFMGRDVSDSRCGWLNYQRAYGAEMLRKPLTPEEIAAILAVNARGSTWEKVGKGWRRRDGKAFAYESTSVRDGLPDNALSVFDADFASKEPNLSPELKRLMLGDPVK